MSAIMPLQREVSWLLPRDVKTALICWGSYLVGLTSYCILYQVIVGHEPPDVAGAIAHVSQNWGVWLLTTPVIFSALRRYATTRGERVTRIVAFAVAVLLVSVTVPVAIDLLTQARDATSSLMLFLPRYVATMGVVYLIWHVFVRERHAPAAAAESVGAVMIHEYERESEVAFDPVAPPLSAPAPKPAPTPATTLLVSKGADRCLIQIGRIECVSAAGNYVEIVERGQRYLMRATLKQVEELLPAADFLRIHRSHLVRRDEIERIKSQPSGNGAVQLRGGRLLPMSKKYKHELRRYRAPD